jgi:hypothetical protein
LPNAARWEHARVSLLNASFSFERRPERASGPSKKNVKTFLGGIRKTIKAALGMSAADLIHKLNPKIRGWADYNIIGKW